MGIDFYYVPGSAPCRAVLLAAKAVGVDLNLKYTDLMKGEHLTPEFIKVSRDQLFIYLFFKTLNKKLISAAVCDINSRIHSACT